MFDVKAPGTSWPTRLLRLIHLTDTPRQYGTAGQYLRLDATGRKLEWTGPGIVTVSTANVSGPPTAAELDAAFGAAAAVGAGFTALVNDAGGDAANYLVASNGTSWWYTSLTKAT